MLKRLELIGFKSFADKTEFTFAAGITAVVGPNGSGKSNVVDAVRWVLGEQSAKSLRGGEMADVIFNGSSTRRSLGMAEVTMTFDNSRRILAVETDEVQITRRVYRDGQGEYLINQQLSRLRDIKDLFLGSGAGHGAYSVIEQGRVDALLQSSHTDRRIIFEEAAGISRFKARKNETLRKLENVDQNLQRLGDIIAEVEKQLRSVRLQAAKAQRFQEHSNRLREMRLGLGLREYHELTGHLQLEEATLTELREGLAASAASSASGEDELARLEVELAAVEVAVHEDEQRLAEYRQGIATREATRDREGAAELELEAALETGLRRRIALAARVAELAAELARADDEGRSAAELARERRAAVQTLEAELTAAERELAELRRQIHADRESHLEQMRLAARLQNDAVSLHSRLEALRRDRERLHLRSTQASEHLASLDVELTDLNRADADIQTQINTTRDVLGRRCEERELLRRQAADVEQAIADLRVRRSALTSRIDVLEQLERSLEGLGTGVREVMQLLRENAEWDVVLGLVADCLTVPRDIAPLIDLALGDNAQRFIVRDSGALDALLARRVVPITGRVGFLPLPATDGAIVPESGDEPPGVLRADRVVRCDRPELAGLPARLLGTTRIVADLATARAIAADPQNSGLRFVTQRGELLEADGTLTVGTHHAEAGILSRKSELRELRQQMLVLDADARDADHRLNELRREAEAIEEPIHELQQEIAALVEQAHELRHRVAQHRAKFTDLHEEVTSNRTEISGLDLEIERLAAEWAHVRHRADAADQAARDTQIRAEQADADARSREQVRLDREHACTRARVDRAQVEERLAGLKARLHQLNIDHAERRRELDALDSQAIEVRQRLAHSRLVLLSTSAAVAELTLFKETAERQLAERTRRRDELREHRRALTEQLHAVNAARQGRLDEAHAHELHAGQLRSRREALVERLREDYQIDLGEVYLQEMAPRGEGEPARTWETMDPIPANDEIAELRRKLARLGSVNLDALQELAELESRANDLQKQHNDLTTAQRSLQDIIAKINHDSRTIFTETFALIRSHFQDLFRKLFGGGMADVVLEDENDILECGIEITARPPGKELRSISLMSGGERTLAAIALLLAIFQAKPSPFCLLDEVDAALDEANNTRLAGVLREFLHQSQFIVITHKKRTMAAADVLYGITMQESGVSKQVSVRFEDWPEDADETAAA
jgi:chromosome segregation protein